MRWSTAAVSPVHLRMRLETPAISEAVTHRSRQPGEKVDSAISCHSWLGDCVCARVLHTLRATPPLVTSCWPGLNLKVWVPSGEGDAVSFHLLACGVMHHAGLAASGRRTPDLRRSCFLLLVSPGLGSGLQPHTPHAACMPYLHGSLTVNVSDGLPKNKCIHNRKPVQP